MSHSISPVRKLRVLVLDGDTRQSLPVMKALRERGHEVVVACESRMSMGWFSRYPHRRVLLPAPSRAEPFIEALVALLRSESYDVTLPLFDLSAHALVEHRERIAPHTHLPMPPEHVFMRARDKALTMQIAQDAGVPCPRTWFPDETPLAEIAAQVEYPVLVKPRISHGAIGIVRVGHRDELDDAVSRTKERYGPVIVQEYVPQTGTQFKAELFRDLDGELRAAVVFDKLRYFPVSGGTSSINSTVWREDIVRDCARLLEAMDWHGYADVDLIEDPRDGTAKVMEINPRVTGSVKIAFEAGVDFADLLVRFALGEALPSYRDYRVGIYMRYVPLDVLWFIFSPERFRAQPSWFRFRGPDLCYQVLSLRDPGPFLALGLSGLRRLASPSVRAEKLSRIGGSSPTN